MPRKKQSQPPRKAGRPPLHLVDWEGEGLGEVPDAVVARRLEVAPSTVRYHREKLKIPAFSWLE